MSGITSRRVIVEMNEGGDFLTMDDTGQVRIFWPAGQVISWVRRRDKRAAHNGVNTATVIEWRNMPEGFIAPSLYD